MENVLNLQQPVIDYIETLTDEEQITTAINFAISNPDCGAEAVEHVVKLSHG